jgi:hypothetical protein
MAVTTPRETWTDPRFADLSEKVDEGFEKTDAGFARVDTDIRELRKEMRGAAIVIIGLLLKAHGL